MTELSRPSPDFEQTLPTSALIKMLGHLAVHAYEHLPLVRNNDTPLFATMEHELSHLPQPLHPDIPTTKEAVRAVLHERKVSSLAQLSISDKLTRSARMIQFTNRTTSPEYAFFDYELMETLKSRFVDSAQQQKQPLDFGRQLAIALDITNDDLSAALTTLWLTSRQYARWLDTASIFNLPNLTPEEIIVEMKEWRGAIRACKSADAKNFQDTAGDSYYAWTHARARVMYSDSNSIPNRIGRLLFKHGTTLNTHRIIKQTIPSDHKIAAAYGNSIGDAIVDAVESA